MVRGLEKFRDHFKKHLDKFILIGGTACSIAMENVGGGFRATKDIDIVLIIEMIDEAFQADFWKFIKQGKYRKRESNEEKRSYYRFQEPEDESFPAIIELFTKSPTTIGKSRKGHLTSIPTNPELSAFSAILLDDSYYEFILSGKTEIAGLPVLGPAWLIPLKAKAWMDLSAKRKRGDQIDESDIRKHRNDIFRIYRILSTDETLELPQTIKNDLQYFFSAIQKENVDLKSLGYREPDLNTVLTNLKAYYRLAD